MTENHEEVRKTTELKLKSIPKGFKKKLLRESEKTVKYLKDSTDDQLTKLQKSFKIIAKTTRPLAQIASCSKGCSTCCEYDVHISSVEALYIHKNIQHEFDFDENPELTKEHKTPCPFLINQQCSIYEFRPIVCRTYYVFSKPANCIPGNQVYCIGNPDNGYMNPYIEEIANWFFNGNTYADIRDFFKKT